MKNLVWGNKIVEWPSSPESLESVQCSLWIFVHHFEFSLKKCLPSSPAFARGGGRGCKDKLLRYLRISRKNTGEIARNAKSYSKRSNLLEIGEVATKLPSNLWKARTRSPSNGLVFWSRGLPLKIKPESMGAPGGCTTCYLSDFNETWPVIYPSRWDLGHTHW